MTERTLHPSQDYNKEIGLIYSLRSEESDQLLVLSKHGVKERPVKVESDNITLQINKTRVKVKSIDYEDNKQFVNDCWHLIEQEYFDRPVEYVRKFFENNIVRSIIGEISKCVWFKDERYYTLLYCWIHGTYMYQIFEYFPFLNVLGMPGTGKTTKLLKTLEKCCFKADIEVDPSKATMFREAEKRKTILFDEDAQKNKDLKALLNSAFQKGITVPRMVRIKGDWASKRFETFTPIAIAGVDELRDATKTRSIPIVMEKKPKDIRVKNIRDDNFREFRYFFILSSLVYAEAIERAYENFYTKFKDDVLSNRTLDLWAPLLAICWVFNRENYSRLLELAKEISIDEKREDLDFTAEKYILKYIWEHKISRATAKQLSERTKKFFEGEVSWLTPQKVARIVKSLKIKRASFIKKGDISATYYFDREAVKRRLEQFGVEVDDD